MGRSLVWVLAVLAATACTKPAPSAPAPPDPAAASAVVRLDKFRADACACTDAYCTLQLAGERSMFLAAEHGRYTFTAEQRAAADAANAGYLKCNEPRDTPEEQAVRAMQGIADDMCACKDKACADAVTADMMKLAERYRDIKPTDELMKRVEPITEKLAKCMTAAMGSEP